MFLRLLGFEVAALLWAGAPDHLSAQALADGPKLEIQTGHVSEIRIVIFSGDSRLIATSDRRGTIRVWEAKTGRQLCSLPRQEQLNAMAFSADGRRLAASVGDGDPILPAEVLIWDLPSQTELRRLSGLPERVTTLLLSPSGEVLATAGVKVDRQRGNMSWVSPGHVQLWNVSNGSELRSVPAASTDVTLAFSPDGQLLAVRQPAHLQLVSVASESGPIEQFDLGNFSGASPVVFRKDGLQTATMDGENLRIWDVAKRRLLRSIKVGYQFRVLGFAGVADECAIDQSGNFEVWDTAAGKRLRTIVNTREPKSALSPDWSLLVVPGQPDSSSLMLRNIVSGAQPTVLSGRVAPAGAVAFSPDGFRLATMSGKRLWLWNLRGGDPKGFHGHEGDWGEIVIDALAFEPQSRRLISADWTGKVVRRDVASGAIESTIEVPARASTRFHAVSADGRWLVSAQADRISVLQIPGWQVRRSIDLQSRAVAISSDGRLLAAASERAHLWDLTSNDHKELAETNGDTLRVAFSPDGKTLASADLAGAITLWDVRTGKAAKTYRVPRDLPVWSLAFSPNGRRLAAGTSEHSILIWDLITDRLIHELKGHLDVPANLAFSPSGRHLASGARDGETRLWDAESGVPVAALIVERNSDEWLIAAPDGRFDGSVAARKNLVAWRNGSSILPAEVWHDRFYTPSLLRAIFGGPVQK